MMTYENSLDIVRHYDNLKAAIKSGGDCESAADGMIDECFGIDSGGRQDKDVARFVKTFPDAGPAAVLAFIRAGWTKALVEAELELLARWSK